MEVIVAVVAHEAERVLPCPDILVLLISDNLVHYSLGSLWRCDRDTAYADIRNAEE